MSRDRYKWARFLFLVVAGASISACSGMTGVQEPWSGIRDNPSFYRETPLDYLWVVNTVKPERISTVALPPQLFEEYGDKVIGSFQRLVHASPDYMDWLIQTYGVNEQQTRDDGSPHQPFAPYNFFVVPTDHRIEWHWLLSSKAIDLGARQVIYEEPEFWVGTGYSQVMRDRYRALYGENVTWRDDTCSFAQRWRMERLKERVLGEAYEKLFRRVKAKNPDVTTIVAMHDVASYQLARITSCFVQNLKNPWVDAIQSQTWDWALEWADDERIAAYFDLAYWVFSSKFRRDLELWLLTDPVNDPLQVTEQNLRDYRAAVDAGILLGYYTHHIPWPASRISAVRKAGWSGYEGEIAQNFELFRSGTKFSQSRLSADSYPQLGYLYTESRNYVTYPSRYRAGKDPLKDVTRGLVEDLLRRGQEFQVVETELVDQPGMLADLKVIIADGEAGGFIPKRTCADALLGWIESGGTLLWLGDEGSFGGIPEYAPSSLAYIAGKMGVGLEGLRTTHPGFVKIKLEKIAGDFDLPDLYLTEPYSFSNVTGAQILYKLPDGRIFAWSKRYGKGRLVYFGYPLSEMRYRETLHWDIVKELLRDQGIGAEEDGLIRFERRSNDLERYEVIWFTGEAGSTHAMISTPNWTTGKEARFSARVTSNRQAVALKTPYFSVFSEDAIPTDTIYSQDSVRVNVESRGRSWVPGRSSAPEGNVTIFLPNPEMVRQVVFSGRIIPPSRRLTLGLGSNSSTIEIRFRERLPSIPGSGIPIGEKMGLAFASILGMMILGCRGATKLTGTRANSAKRDQMGASP